MKSPQEPGFLRSLICFGGVIAIVIVGILWPGINLHTLLMIALVWVAGHAAALGFGFDEIKSAMISGIEKGLGAFFIFFLIGVLIAALTPAQVLNSLNDGYTAHTGVKQLDSLLSGGGVQSMMWTMSLALLALSLGGILHRAGFVRVLMSRLLSLSIIFCGQTFKRSFEDHDLEKPMLSRCLEEGATLSTPPIPWTTSGAFITGVLGMSPLE